MKHVDRIDSEIDSGVTRPYRGFIGNKRGIIKIANTNYGDKILINELLSYYLAELLHIKIPSGELCFVDDKTELNPDLEYYLSEEMLDIRGLCFFSSEIMNCTTFCSEFEVDCLENKEEINMIILFDFLLNNRDRHELNLLLNMSDANMYIIDHSHIFDCKDSNMWTGATLREFIRKEDFKDTKIFEKNIENVYNSFIKANIVNIGEMNKLMRVFEESITRKSLEVVVNKLPQEWRLKYADDINMFIEYILYRVEHINIAIDIIEKVVLLERGFGHEN